MELRSVFNILLLSLSLATLLITLFSYILYKLRQITARNLSGEVYKLEGVFFRRFAPRLDQINQKAIRALPVESRFHKFSQNIALLLVIVFIVISTTFLLENYFTDRRLRKSRILLADNYRQLLDSGLLRKYDYDPNFPDLTLKEVLPESTFRLIQSLSASLKNKTVALYETMPNQVSNKVQYKEVKKGWSEFLSRHRIPYVQASSYAQLKKADLILIPQSLSLSQREKTILQELSQIGKPLFATGPIGVLDGTGELSIEEFSNHLFGVQFIYNREEVHQWPTLFSSAPSPSWDLPPGLLLNWYPRNSTYYAIASKPSDSEPSNRDYIQVAAYQANADGIIRNQVVSGVEHQIVHSVFHQTPTARTAWTALEPTEMSALQPELRNYADLMLLSSLCWAASIPRVAPAFWKGGRTSAFVLSLDLPTRFDKPEKILTLLSKRNLPATFFMSADSLQAFREDIQQLSSNIELALYQENIEKILTTTPRETFDHMEGLRLDLEEMVSQKVTGLHLFKNKAEPLVFNAAAQNKVEYIFGSQLNPRFSPLFFNKGEIILFPQLALSAEAIKNNRMIATENQTVQIILQQMKAIEELRGAYFFTGNADAFHQSDLSIALDKVFESPEMEHVWITSFRELALWWKARLQLQVQLEQTKEGKQQLTLSNKANTSLSDVVFLFDMGTTPLKWKIESMQNLGGMPGDLELKNIERGPASLQLRIKKIPKLSRLKIMLQSFQ